MLKFLVGPGFKFATDLIGHLTSCETEAPYKRILIYPITNGLRMRNLEDTLQVEFEVTGGAATAIWSETVRCGEMLVPYTKRQTFSPTDVLLIAEKIEAFFEGKWSIDKE